ncbi:JAB domain-containing protein [Sorangium sp. So ce1000]|uniref:JAB domain-containing protein n=1 Tax=Sorangium sp. So ce1000 TaxID=3133325 RepID=UPI003F5FFDBB
MVLGLPGVGSRILGTAALPSLGRLSPAALAERTQIALFDATRLAAAFELGRRYHAARARRGALLTDAARVARYFGPRLASLVHEDLWIAALDTHGRVRETRLLARGGADVLTIDRATVMRTALDMAAQSFVLAHNHPSGDPTPTREDEAMTLELRHLGDELHVPLTAHVIVTPSGRYAAVHE